MPAFLTLVEDRRPLVCTSRLDRVVLQLGMLTFRTCLLDRHFGLFPPLLLHGGRRVLFQPFFPRLYVQSGSDGLAYELLEGQFALAASTGYLSEQGV